MGINYQRRYDYRPSGMDQVLRRPIGRRSPSPERQDRLACPGPRRGRGAGVSSSTRFPLLSGGRWAYWG